jgi:hypothetical protein
MVGCDYVALSRTVNTGNLSIIQTKNSVGNDIDIDFKRFFRSKDDPTIRKWHEERRVFMDTMKVLQADTVAQWVFQCVKQWVVGNLIRNILAVWGTKSQCKTYELRLKSL